MPPKKQIAQPLQPVAKDSHGVLRFRANELVRYLLDNGGIDLNKLACLDFSNEDRQQFAQLIGYSLSGYGELSYVDDTAYALADAASKGKTDPRDATIKHLSGIIARLKKALRRPMADLFEIHPDDLYDP